MVELLAPAGSLESLRAAVNAGADAVYIGGSRFGARAYADNPSEEELLLGMDYCHIHRRKLYMTVNTLLKERELEESLYPYLLPYYRGGLDGVIVQDFGVMRFLLERFPGLPVHASTQMTVTGAEGARLLQQQGVTRVVTARELSLEEIRRIIEETGIEVETFIHGAMCYSYSGQCLFSSMIGGRSGNRGRCAQPCRLPYQLKDETGTGRCGQKCLLSMKDMCTLDLLPELLDAGIASLKIEGRMKRPEYTAGVVSIYRKYIDRCLELGIGTDAGSPGGTHGSAAERFRRLPIAEEDRRMLKDLYNRGGFTDGYYHRHNGTEMMSMERPNHFGTAAAKVCAGKKGKVTVVALEPLHKRDVLELHDAPVEFTAGADVREGETVPLPKRMETAKLKNGSIFYRTKSEQLLEQLKERYLDRNCKEKINGDLKIFAGSPAILELNCGGTKVTVCSAHAAEPAQSQPTGRAAVEKQLQKTGNTPFEFETLTMKLEDGLFLPVRELNELRRQGLEALEQAMLAETRRVSPDERPCSASDRENAGVRGAEASGYLADGLSVSVMTEEQLDAVLQVKSSRVTTIYLDLSLVGSGMYRAEEGRLKALLGRVQECGYRCCLNFPPVFRKGDRRVFERLKEQQLLGQFDGFLLHTIDELAYIRAAMGSGARLIADDTFYAYNGQAACFLMEHGIDSLTLPAELNFRELKALTAAKWNSGEPVLRPDGKSAKTGVELVAYGHQALMHSAQCLVKNTGGCTARTGVQYLRDRKNVEFPVINRCASCCNTIYNSVPLELADCRKEIAELGPRSLRLSFTIESGQETEAVIRRYESAFFGGWPDESDRESFDAAQSGTRGHFRRGVE